MSPPDECWVFFTQTPGHRILDTLTTVLMSHALYAFFVLNLKDLVRDVDLPWYVLVLHIRSLVPDVPCCVQELHGTFAMGLRISHVSWIEVVDIAIVA